MRVVITGSSRGIGRAIAEKFLMNGDEVHGIDVLESSINDRLYTHHVADVRGKLPDIENVDILINNAGVQNTDDDIGVNLLGVINCTEKYGIHPNIKSIVNMSSVSGHTGAEFPEYAASKGGVLAYTKNTAKRLAEYGATCNSISPGGVITPINDRVMNDPDKWQQIMDLTPLKKWATAEEIAEWTYFIAKINKSATAQDIIIDNGENSNSQFVW